jgi:hypothetical protein
MGIATYIISCFCHHIADISSESEELQSGNYQGIEAKNTLQRFCNKEKQTNYYHFITTSGEDIHPVSNCKGQKVNCILVFDGIIFG